jgi:hypothetical protein
LSRIWFVERIARNKSQTKISNANEIIFLALLFEFIFLRAKLTPKIIAANKKTTRAIKRNSVSDEISGAMLQIYYLHKIKLPEALFYSADNLGIIQALTIFSPISRLLSTKKS